MAKRQWLTDSNAHKQEKQKGFPLETLIESYCSLSKNSF